MKQAAAIELAAGNYYEQIKFLIMNTELIICPKYQASVFEAQATGKGCEIISARPDGFDNVAYGVKGEAVYNEEWQEELRENGIDVFLCPCEILN